MMENKTQKEWLETGQSRFTKQLQLMENKTPKEWLQTGQSRFSSAQ